MKQLKGNLFDLHCDALCITTNGFVKANGACVMGKGCAYQLTQYDPSVVFTLGKLIESNGNIVQIIDHYQIPVIAFPVKPVKAVSTKPQDAVKHMRNKFNYGDTIPGWACTADIAIIIQSAHDLVKLTNQHGWKTVLIPRPGCGAGELDWDDVYPILNEILDDRFYAVTY